MKLRSKWRARFRPRAEQATLRRKSLATLAYLISASPATTCRSSRYHHRLLLLDSVLRGSRRCIERRRDASRPVSPTTPGNNMTSSHRTVLDAYVGHPTTDGAVESYSYYHAGPLFTVADLNTNVLLSRAISRHSQGKYQPLLPQDLEQRGHVTPHTIRDKDIRALLSCDLALFTYDGAELDSGTVVEFMIAKMADIPCVILRSDFRHGGDQSSKGSAGQPWNLMSSFWPRTTSVVIDAMTEYKQALAKAINGSSIQEADVSRTSGEQLVESMARQCVAALDEALKTPSRMPKHLRPHVYQWIALMPGFAEGEDDKDQAEATQLAVDKERKGLFK